MKFRDDDIKELILNTVEKDLPSLSPEIKFIAFDQNLVPFATRINYNCSWKYIEDSLKDNWRDVSFGVLSKIVDDKIPMYIWKIGTSILSGTLDSGFHELIGACILDVYCDKSVPSQLDTHVNMAYQKVSKYGFGFMETMLCSLLQIHSPANYSANKLYEDFDKIHAVPYIPEMWLDLKDLKLDALKLVWKNLSKMTGGKSSTRKWVNGVEVFDGDEDEDVTRLDRIIERARKLAGNKKEDYIGIDVVAETRGHGWNIIKLSDVLIDPGKYEDQANIIEIDSNLEVGEVILTEDTIVWAQLSFGLMEIYTTIDNIQVLDLVERFLEDSLRINVSISTT
jgi:hypothetical protein